MALGQVGLGRNHGELLNSRHLFRGPFLQKKTMGKEITFGMFKNFNSVITELLKKNRI